MTSLKNFLATTFGILGALLLVPFVAFFGLLMFGLAFGLALIAAAAAAVLARRTTGEGFGAAASDAGGSAAQAQPA